MPPIFTSLASGSIRSYGLINRVAAAQLANIVIRVFGSASTFTVPTGITKINYLIVGGGGGGTEGAGGHGGGGGEVVTGIDYPVTPGATISIGVGGGGYGNDPRSPFTPLAPAPMWFAGNGTNSTFGSAPSQIVARYGEGAQGTSTYTGPRGVSRGGGSGAGWTSPLYLGGTGFTSAYNEKGGGGGGAGGAGQNYGTFDPNYAGNGGIGIFSSITGANVGYGGGGAGGGTVPAPSGGAYAGYGQAGGGRMEPVPAYGGPGTTFYGYIANGLGGSGGGGGGGNAYVGSGQGGSGIVIISYSDVTAANSPIHILQNTTTFSIPTGVTTMQYLVVAGGGGAGSGGGGGAGGYRASPSYAVTPGTSFTVIVGGGGNRSISPFAIFPTAGSNSGFYNASASVWSTGGGYGGQGGNGNAGNGGSGGGAGASTGGGPYTGGTGTPGQGNNGGTSYSQPGVGNFTGGGGGAGAAGQNGNAPSTGPAPYYSGGGGNGIENAISGTPLYYAGGGGAYGTPGANTAGGLGGGGAGRGPTNAPTKSGDDGAAGTGGGGGAGEGAASPDSFKSAATGGGNGGSGIVILRFS